MNGKVHSEETKRKISEAKIDKKQSRETIKKRVESRKGFRFSEETKKKMSKTAKLRGTGKWTKGRKLSEKHKRKLSQSKMGEKNPMWRKNFSKEHKRKLSNALIGNNRARKTITFFHCADYEGVGKEWLCSKDKGDLLMFWYIFRIKPLSRLIKNHIKQLKCEHNKMSEYLKLLPKKSFGYARISLGIAFWELKIEIWKAMIGENKSLTK